MVNNDNQNQNRMLINFYFYTTLSSTVLTAILKIFVTHSFLTDILNACKDFFSIVLINSYPYSHCIPSIYH